MTLRLAGGAGRPSESGSFQGLRALVAIAWCTMEMEGPLGWSTER